MQLQKKELGTVFHTYTYTFMNRNPSAVDADTVSKAYIKRIKKSPEQAVIKYKKNKEYVALTWSQLHEQVLKVYNYLDSQNLKPGDKVCIFSQSRAEWLITDIAVMGGGFVTVPIYHSSSVEDISFLIEHSECKLVFVEDFSLLLKLQTALKASGKQVPIVSFDSIENIQGFAALPAANSQTEKKFIESSEKTQPDDLATIVYTSGTTGLPKGAILTHHNLASEVRGACEIFALEYGEMTLTFLPFAHILGREESLFPIYSGLTLGFAENLQTVAQDIEILKPTVMVSVPRIYEKIYSKIQSELQAKPKAVQNLFAWALKIGRKVALLREQKKAIPFPLHFQFSVADKLVLSKIRNKLGGKLKFTISGGAPLSRDLCEIFHACGIKILEGYGLTETTGACYVNRVDDYRFGTVGLAFPGVEVKIAEDGEILVRGSIVFKGYYKNPEATNEALTADGWFCTGDIGEIEDGRYLKITDRKKEIIVSSGGKNIAPQKLENLLKTSRWINQALVSGDKQKYIVALLSLHEADILNWAKQNGISSTKFTDIIKEPSLLKIIEEEITRLNAQLASYETIKRFRILPGELTIDAGEITPSLKVKRKVCYLKYRNLIEEMYK